MGGAVGNVGGIGNGRGGTGCWGGGAGWGGRGGGRGGNGGGGRCVGKLRSAPFGLYSVDCKDGKGIMFGDCM